MDPEAVLLVDDDQTQVGELDLVLDECVGADHQTGLAARDRGEQGGALLPLVPPREPEGLDAQGPEPAGEPPPMLLGQELRGRHQGRLAAALDGLERRQGRHHGLARAHIPLEHALHGMGAGEVRLDLRDRLLLIRCQAKGQTLAQPPAQGTVPIQDRGPLPLVCATQAPQAHLVGHQLLEGQAQECRVPALQEVRQARLDGWPVEIAQGLHQTRQSVTADGLRGQVIRRGPVGEEHQGLLRQGPPGDLLQTLGRGVDRGQAGLRLQVLRPRVPGLVLRVDHLQAIGALAYLPIAAQPRAGAQRGHLLG